MKNYKNLFLLRDNDNKYGRVDLVILTDEEEKEIEGVIDELKDIWHESECDFVLIDEIIDYLTLELDCVIYTYPQEIWY
jgi:hypothetical protein